MFLCCGRRGTPAKGQNSPQQIDDDDEPNQELVTAGNAPARIPAVESAPPAPLRVEMDYVRARRDSEDKMERDREHRKSLYLTQTMEKTLEDDDNDWARDLMDSVSKAASTYTGLQSRSATPEVEEEMEKEVEVKKAEAPEAKSEAKPEAKPEAPAEEEKKEVVELDIKRHTSLYISAEIAASYMDYESFAAPPMPTLMPVKVEESVVQEPFDDIHYESEPEPEQEKTDEEQAGVRRHTSLYISATAAAAYINYDSCLNLGIAPVAPPTPAASISDCETSRPQFLPLGLISSPSPAPSIKRSTITDISDIAAAAAAVATVRQALAGSRLSGASTYSVQSEYSVSSSYSTRSSSSGPPPIKRVSMLRIPVRRLSDSSSMDNETYEEKLAAILVPLTSQLLPKLDKLLSNTSILSNYGQWESAMSLRRDAREFVANGADDYLCEHTGAVENSEKLKNIVDSYMSRGRAVDAQGAADESVDFSDNEDDDESARNFWTTGGRSSAMLI